MHVHLFAPLGDVDLDENIAPLVLACWTAGVPTVFSCQGSPPWDDAYVDVLPCDEEWLTKVAATADIRIAAVHDALWAGELPAVRVYLEPDPATIVRFADAVRAAGPRRTNPILDMREQEAESERSRTWLDTQHAEHADKTPRRTGVERLIEDLRDAVDMIEGEFELGTYDDHDRVAADAVDDFAADLIRTLGWVGGTDWHLRDDEPYRSLRAHFHDRGLLRRP
jgi:hypothetical protein